ncbi:MAG: DUF3333 domain-containing protein, partial [Woeseiaceae bacterium]|nr:DUF3333 domain-containing protein [Woeseiaceae bacterium]NIP19506.1 DUF3333 domain-containing protein [Woeseiaceae bacterium]NIS88465.1 DUF3333 domain-containing protein [Woeseiaceae bacterium]
MADRSVKVSTLDKVEAGLAKRYRKEAVFRLFGLIATAIGVVFLAIFFSSLVSQGSSAFAQTYLELEVEYSPEILAPAGQLDLAYADFDAIARNALRRIFPEVTGRRDRRALNQLLSVGAGYQIREALEENPELLGTSETIRVPASANVDMVIKGNIDREIPESQRPVSDQQIAWIDHLLGEGLLVTQFNSALFSNGDSREPELAGIRGALMGSFYMLTLTIALSFPIGAAAAIYLEEFAPKNRWSDLIEVNIN